MYVQTIVTYRKKAKALPVSILESFTEGIFEVLLRQCMTITPQEPKNWTLKGNTVLED